MATFQAAEAKQPTDMLKITYVTDIEGNFDYFKRFVDSSPGVSFVSQTSPDLGII